MRRRVCVLMVGLAGAACAGVLPEGFEKNQAVFRGPDGSGLYRDAGALPTAWNEKEKKGILWKAALDMRGWSSPVVWSNRVVVTMADAAQRKVACFDAATGKPAWSTELPAAAGATEAYTLDTQSDEWNDRMHAAATPATNGKHVFVLFSNGQLAALDLAGGAVVWTIGLGDTSGNKYGTANSLLVFGANVIVVFQGKFPFIAAYDGATGREVWNTPRKSETWASPILIRTAAGKHLVVLPAQPDVVAWDAEKGTQAWTVDVLASKFEYCGGPSPVFADGMVVVNGENNGIFGIDPDKGQKVWGLTELPNGDGFPEGVSMTTDGKHVYQYFKTAITCVDARSGKVVKQKDFDESSSYASPLVAGGNLYLFGVGETAIVKANPAADFPEVGKGVLEESFDSSPAAAGGRLFIRNDTSLYCIGK